MTHFQQFMIFKVNQTTRRFDVSLLLSCVLQNKRFYPNLSARFGFLKWGASPKTSWSNMKELLTEYFGKIVFKNNFWFYKHKKSAKLALFVT